MKKVTDLAIIVDTKYDDKGSVPAIIPYLTEILRHTKRPIFICVGTPKIVGDSLGPLVGSKVLAQIPGIPLYGTFEAPVHARNITVVLKQVMKSHPDATLIGVDSSMSSQARVGYICLNGGKLRPGIAVRGGLPAFGEYKLYGNTSSAGEHGLSEAFQHLLEVSPEMIGKMADVISACIIESWKNAFSETSTQPRDSELTLQLH